MLKYWVAYQNLYLWIFVSNYYSKWQERKLVSTFKVKLLHTAVCHYYTVCQNCEWLHTKWYLILTKIFNHLLINIRNTAMFYKKK